MILILPAAAAAIYAYVKLKTNETAEAVARAILIFEVLLLVITDLFSLCHALNRYTVFFSWLFVLFIFSLLYGKEHGFPYLLKRIERKASDTDKTFRILRFVMWGLLIILSLVLLVGAVFTVPYNYDSMSYHLARIGYWIDHQSVAHYVSNIDRQIYSPVLAEYNLLHMMLLSGNDTFVNFLQYISMFAAAYFIYHGARRLGTNRTFSLFGAFVFMMMPLTISQSITTQNDLFVTVFFAIFVYELIGVVKWDRIILNREQVLTIVMLGLTVAFAYLAKTSVCASMLFFMPWLLIVRLRKKDRVGKLMGSAGIAAVSIIVPVSETWIRTYLSSGSLMTDTASGDIMVATKNISYILVNILKNFSLLITQHICRPLNGFVYRIAIHTGQALGVEVNHEAIAFHGFDFLRHMNMGDDMYSHDKTPSAFAAYLAVIAGVLLIVLLVRLLIGRKKLSADVKGQWGLSLGYAVSAWLSLGFIMALLRWQPWGTRLLYPALAMTVMMSANLLWLFMSRMGKGIQNVILSVLILLCTILAVPSVTYNMKPAGDFLKNGCKDRLSYYFVYNQRRGSYEDLLECAQAEEVGDIGLIISGDGYDYPLWLMFHEQYPQGKLRHIIAEERADEEAVAPEAILMVEREEFSVGDTYEYGGETYVCTYVNEDNKDAYLSLAK
ncbi:MAG: hypothetical protein ACI4AA_06285 [Lachnospiraceae bacterium]